MYSAGMTPQTMLAPQRTPEVFNAPGTQTMAAPQMPPPIFNAPVASTGLQMPQPVADPGLQMPQLPQQANPMAQQQMMARQLRGPGMGAPQMPMQAQGNPMQPQRGRWGQPQMSAGASISRR